MKVSNSTFYAKIDIPKYLAQLNNVQQDKTGQKTDSVSIPVKYPAKTAFGGLASYKDMVTRSAPLMSDEAFMEVARKQARKDFANNVFQGDEFGALAKAFVSVVSPDRVGMIENAMKNGSSSTLKRAPHLWEILWPLEKGKGTALPVSDIGFRPDGSIHHFFITDSAGNNIILYEQDRGWSDISTPEEVARGKILLQVYNDEWKLAKSEIGTFEQTPFDLGVGKYSKLA